MYCDKLLLGRVGSGINEVLKVSVVLASIAYFETNIISALTQMSFILCRLQG